jgi:hypothetical protein
VQSGLAKLQLCLPRWDNWNCSLYLTFFAGPTAFERLQNVNFCLLGRGGIRFSRAVSLPGENGFFFAGSGSGCWHLVNPWRWGNTMKNTALLTFVFVAASYPTIAKQQHHHHRPGAAISHERITCEMVRAYVAQIGLAQAKAMAQATGMTASEEREAVQCLEKKI